jgi:CPA1 family monovalent cation:H+ antiporter
LTYKKSVENDNKILEQINLSLASYRRTKIMLVERIAEHTDGQPHDEVAEAHAENVVAAQIIAMERAELLRLWREEKINLHIRNKLLDRLDHRSHYIHA